MSELRMRADAFEAALRVDPEAWFASCAVILDEEGAKVVGPKPNILQRRVFAYYRECQRERKPCKFLILKPRRKGASTVIQALIYHHFQRYPGRNGTLMGDKEGTSDKIFEVFRLMAMEDPFFRQDGTMPDRGKVGNTDDDIILPNGSHYGKETAGSANAGRGGTIQVGNMTEVAHFRRDPTLEFLPSAGAAMRHAVGLLAADSTPNGPTGWFYETAMASLRRQRDGEAGRVATHSDGWRLIFAAWWEFEDSTLPFPDAAARAEFMRTLHDFPEYEERRELELYGTAGQMTPEHLHWRRMMIDDVCKGDVNRFRQEYPSDPEECFLLSSRKKFNVVQVAGMKKRVVPGRRGRLVLQSPPTPEETMGMGAQGGRALGGWTRSRAAMWQPDESQLGRLHEEPIGGCRYIVSADFMTGEDQIMKTTKKSDPDYHSVQVWRQSYWLGDALTGEQVRHKLVYHYRSREDTDVAAEQAAAASWYYGGALIVPEVNNCGLHPVKVLVAMGCNVFRRQASNPTTGLVERAYGWRTDALTRPTVLDELGRLIREGLIEVEDATVVEEFGSMIVTDSGRAEAMSGAHDDTVLAAAIALYNMSLATVYRRPTVRESAGAGELRMGGDYTTGKRQRQMEFPSGRW